MIGDIKFIFKTVLETLPNIVGSRRFAMFRFTGFFSLENIIPFRWLVLAATRRSNQPLGSHSHRIKKGPGES